MQRRCIPVFIGHTPDRQGAMATDGRTEHAIVRDHFAWRLASALQIIGSPKISAEVPDPAAVLGIRGKAEWAKQHGAVLALDLHLNASGSPSAEGLWICHHDTASPGLLAVALRIVDNVRGTWPTKVRDYRLDDSRDGFAEQCAAAGVPGLVIEIAFLTNAADIDRAISCAGPLMIELARAILAALPANGEIAQ